MLSQTSRRGAVALATLFASAGCAVSFDGYTLDERAAAGSAGAGTGVAGRGGAATGGGSAGATLAGKGGAAGTAGTGGLGGTSGNAGASGGSGGSPAGSAGATMGGGAGAGGAGAGGAGAGGAGAGGAGTAGAGGAGAGGAGTAGAGGAGAGGAGTAGAGGAGAGGAGAGGAGTAGAGGAGAGGDAGAGGAGAGGAAGGPLCPTNLAGPELLAVETSSGKTYCIDATEVLQIHYKAFLDSNEGTNTRAGCGSNATFAPSNVDGGSGCDPTDFTPTTKAKYPVRCVDWCDADAYCRWTGKRLCGAVGGGDVPVASFADASVSQWFNACSAKGAQRYPYSDTFSDIACNTLLGMSNTASAGFYSTCEGSVPGLFDMSGNVGEWEDSCTGTGAPFDKCSVRGGDFNSTNTQAPSAACDSAKDGASATASYKERRDYAAQAIGFRCCFDP